MTFSRALAYFVSEALVSLGRSWKVSLLAVATAALSLFVGGLFLLVGENLARFVEQAREESRLVVYLRPEAPAGTLEEVAARAGGRPWVRSVERVDRDEAARRFAATFPEVAELVTGEPGSLPASVELEIDPRRARGAAFERWREELAALPAVEAVDDDREWVRRLDAAVAVVRALGLALGGVLLAAAVLTIASVVRLTAHLYRDEIDVMRLVGATEFYIRGPFFVEGLLQGAFGGLIAAGALWATHAAIGAAGGGLAAELAFSRFLPAWQLAALVGTGAAAGLAGAVLSLRRERVEKVAGEGERVGEGAA